MARKNLTRVQKTYQFLKSHLAFSLIGLGVFLLVMTAVAVSLNQRNSNPDSASATNPVNSSKPRGGFVIPREEESSSSVVSSSSQVSSSVSSLSSSSSQSSISSSSIISSSLSSSSRVSSTVSSILSSSVVSSSSQVSSTSSSVISSVSSSNLSSIINFDPNNPGEFRDPSKGDPVKGELVQPPTTGETVRSGGADVLIGGLAVLVIIISYLTYRKMKQKSALTTKEKKLK